MNPAVSVCLPTFNNRAFLDARVETLQSQSQEDWELVICDSGSTDGTQEFLQPLTADPRVRFFSVAREGIYAGWNECLRRARGEFVYIAPADDTCDPRLLEKLCGTLSCQPDADLALCDFSFIDAAGCTVPPPRGLPSRFYGDWMTVPHRRDRRLEFLVHTCMGVSWTTITSLVFRRRILERTGLFRTDCGAFADQFWAMRTALYSDSIYVPEKLATWRIHPAQGSSQESIRLKRRNYRIAEALFNEAADQLPCEWRKTIGWRQSLLWRFRSEFHRAFCLDCQSLRTAPGRFIRGALLACLMDPALLVRRLASGLTWQDEMCEDDQEHLQSLIDLWQVPMPERLQ